MTGCGGVCSSCEFYELEKKMKEQMEKDKQAEKEAGAEQAKAEKA